MNHHRLFEPFAEAYVHGTRNRRRCTPVMFDVGCAFYSKDCCNPLQFDTRGRNIHCGFERVPVELCLPSDLRCCGADLTAVSLRARNKCR
jgi:hypothetical protein